MPTEISWTNETWNPIAGCSKVSEGCKNCYAIKDAVRLAGNNNPKISKKYAGTTKIETNEERWKANWTGKINFASDDVLTQPLRWTRPRMIFVNSMSDLFHENVPDEWIDEIFAVMCLAPQHTFQILTKRAERMQQYMQRIVDMSDLIGMTMARHVDFDKIPETDIFPPKHIWLGVSVENQKAADERIPLLLQTPAAVRWLSCEPLLEEVHLVDPIVAETWDEADQWHHGEWDYLGHAFEAQKKKINGFSFCKTCGNRLGNPMHNNRPNKEHSDWKYIDWVVVGGESGTNARPCNIDWIRSIVNQCKSANVPVFVKQLGAWVYEGKYWKSSFLPLPVKQDKKVAQVSGITKVFPFMPLKDKKGGDINEFPEDLRIRQFPF